MSSRAGEVLSPKLRCRYVGLKGFMSRYTGAMNALATSAALVGEAVNAYVADYAFANRWRYSAYRDR
jgi:hypothetical protein